MKDSEQTGSVTLSEEEKARYAWQMWCPNVGEAGQEKLKAATVLVSRAGGVGGNVALQLAAAGVGKLVIAHGGQVKPGDLNRQLLMSGAQVGDERSEWIQRSLRQWNPHVEVEVHALKVNEDNADALIEQVDVVASCAPMFEERYAMNAACVRAGKPMVDAAMYDFGIQVGWFDARTGPCLRCVLPEAPPDWKRQFPVFGAVSAVAGSLAAVEVIQWITGAGVPRQDSLWLGSLREGEFRRLPIKKDPQCPVCGANVVEG